MNHVERFRAVMNFQPVDRLPRWEWAMWWDKTIARWKRRGPARRAEAARSSTSPSTSASTPTSSSGSPRPTRRSRPCSITSRASSRTWTTTSASGRSSSRTTTRRSSRCGPGPTRQAPRRGRRLDHAGRLLLVPAHADGLHEAQPGLLRPAGADPPDQPGPDRLQPAAPRPGRRGLRADVRHDRRGHVLQPRADDLRAASSTSSSRRTTGRSCPGCRSWASSPIVDTDGDVTLLVPWLQRRAFTACCRWSGRRAWTA